jgi:hypothetical protein
VSKKIKHQSFTLQSLIRLSIFILVLYFGVLVISSSKSPITDNSTKILGDFVENLNDSSQVKTIRDKIDPIINQITSYPQKYIKDLQKQFIKKFSDDLINSLE